MPTIYNCHIHTFTIDHVPDQFLPLGLCKLVRYPFMFRLLIRVLKNMRPGDTRDRYHRYANFAKIAAEQKGQRGVMESVLRYYPRDAKFVVLPMDMALMGRGLVAKDIDAQHEELAQLCKDPKIGPKIIPFASVDPRREDALDKIQYLVEHKGFRGIKIYPPLGYYPYHERLMNDIYPYLEAKRLPVLAHCSNQSVVRHKDLSIQDAAQYANPDNYKQVMKALPKLRICLGHFGGNGAWEEYLLNPQVRDGSERTNWVTKILDMIESEEYPHLYADISYTIFKYEDNAKILKVLLSDPRVCPYVLFGSDYYMVEREKLEEKRLSMYLRATLGEDLFWQIAETNPKAFLG